jgi:hypothetical protein
MNYKKISKIIVTGLLFFFSTNIVTAQSRLAIGNNSFNIDPNAVLELQSSVAGFLPPRLTEAKMNELGTALGVRITAGETKAGDGMIIFVTDPSTGSAGLRIWSLTGDRTDPATTIDDTSTYTAGWVKLEDSANKSSNISLTYNGSVVPSEDYTASSDLLYPTQKAVKTYVDESIKSIKDKRYVNSVREILSSATGNDLKISITDYTVLCSGGLTIELPAVDASQAGRILVIRKTDNSSADADKLEFNAAGGQISFNGDTISSLNYQKTIRVQAFDTNWVVID